MLLPPGRRNTCHSDLRQLKGKQRPSVRAGRKTPRFNFNNYEHRSNFSVLHIELYSLPLIADSTLSNSKNIRTASSSGAPGIWEGTKAENYTVTTRDVAVFSSLHDVSE